MSTSRRAAVGASVVGLGALALTASLVSGTTLAASLTAASEDTHVYVDGLSGSDVGLAATTATHAQSTGDATAAERARVGLRLSDVALDGLCVIATHEVPGLGESSVIITAGEPVDGRRTGEDPVRLESLTLDLSALEGEAHDVRDLVLGASAEQLPSAPGAPGAFGVSVGQIDFDALDLDTGALDLTSGLSLPDLQVRTTTGEATRSDCTS